MYGLLIALIGGTLLWAVLSMIPKNKGEWSEDARRQGRYRARHWTFKASVPSVKAFLLPYAATTKYWPILANAAGCDALSGAADTELGSMAWRSCAMESFGAAASLLFTVQFPQLSDGREIEFPEVLFTRHSDSAADEDSVDSADSANSAGSMPRESEAHWEMTTEEPEAAQDLLAAAVKETLAACEQLHSAYFVDSSLTVVCAESGAADDMECRIDELIGAAHRVLVNLPASLWA